MVFKVAISGLRAANTDLSVIGNNVANVATNGFKRSRAEFADVYSATGFGTAGNIPGSGVQVARVAQQFGQGNISFTDNALDLAISGSGFFLLDDGGSEVYSRAGAFGIDREGFVVNADGANLVVFDADTNGNVTGLRTPLQLNNATVPPNATTEVDLNLNLDASDDDLGAGTIDPTNTATFNRQTSLEIFDSLGGSHLLQTYYRKTANNTWDVAAYIGGTLVGGANTVSFTNAGAIAAGGTIALPAHTPAGGAANLNITLDFNGSTQFGNGFAVNSLIQDGFTAGELTGIDIDAEGVVFARFSNGQSQVEGQIALASFRNEQGLQPLGSNNFGETFTSGQPLVGPPASSNLGLIQAGALEESNVDLAEELVNMIVAQRNFQANTEVISTADATMQSIINIR